MKHKIKHKLKHAVTNENGDNKEKKMVIIFISVFIVVLTSALLFFQGKVNTKSEEVEEHEEIVDEQHEENISKEESENEVKKQAEAKASAEIAEINTQIHELLKDNEKYYGIYYYDLTTGMEYSINGDEEFHAASTIKVPVAMMVSDRLYNKEISENTLIEYTSSDKEDGAGILQGEISEGDKREVSQLMMYMIEESDNIATSMLKRNVGNVAEYVANVTLINAENNKNYITPRQSCLVLRKLYEESSSNIYYRKVVQMMKETSSHDRLDKYIPNNMVAHKIGDYDKYVNDIGIVYTENPYILAVYTKDVMEEGRENIAQISKAIYDIKTNN